MSLSAEGGQAGGIFSLVWMENFAYIGCGVVRCGPYAVGLLRRWVRAGSLVLCLRQCEKNGPAAGTGTVGLPEFRYRGASGRRRGNHRCDRDAVRGDARKGECGDAEETSGGE